MYTPKEYTAKALEANQKGQKLYIMRDRETLDDTLVIAPIGYYIMIDDFTYGEINPEYENEERETCRTLLFATATTKAKKAIADGYITYHNLEIETDAETVSDLNEAITTMEERKLTTFDWYDRNDNVIAMTKLMLRDVIATIGEFKACIWAKHFDYKDQITKAKTIEELKAIHIDYSDIKIDNPMEETEEDWDDSAEEFIEDPEAEDTELELGDSPEDAEYFDPEEIE